MGCPLAFSPTRALCTPSRVLAQRSWHREQGSTPGTCCRRRASISLARGTRLLVLSKTTTRPTRVSHYCSPSIRRQLRGPVLERRTSTTVGMSTSEWALQIHGPTVLPRRQRVDRDREREDQRCVFAVGDLNAVGLAHADPLLGDRRDRVTVTLDLVLVVDDVPMRL